MHAELPGNRVVEAVQHRAEPADSNQQRVGNKRRLSHVKSRLSRYFGVDPDLTHRSLHHDIHRQSDLVRITTNDTIAARAFDEGLFGWQEQGDPEVYSMIPPVERGISGGLMPARGMPTYACFGPPFTTSA